MYFIFITPLRKPPNDTRFPFHIKMSRKKNIVEIVKLLYENGNTFIVILCDLIYGDISVVFVS